MIKNRSRRKKYQKNEAQVCLNYHMSIIEENVRFLNIEDVLQSSKTTIVQIQLKSWLNEKSKNKIIMFSQFYLLFVSLYSLKDQS